MTTVQPIEIETMELDTIAPFDGSLALIVGGDGKLNRPARRINRLTKGALGRLVASPAFEKLKQGEAKQLSFPSGLQSEQLIVVKLDQRAQSDACRKGGAAIAKLAPTSGVLVLAGNLKQVGDLSLGLTLRRYSFDDHKSKKADAPGPLTMMVNNAETAKDKCADVAALAEGVFFTRDLTNEPANVLNTVEFADRLSGLSKLGVKVEVLEEEQLEELGMRTLLAVGEGSETPTKVVVMQWNGGGKEAPLALVGKGVVFDTGGISIKPAVGMEDMAFDMGGAGVVSGVMKTLAMRKAKANVVGIVGLVENMPDGRAQRPGDVVTSMKGDTIEVINTDAEGRLVLCDIMWYAQDRFKPVGLIDLATLTGAVIIALGHENAGAFSNDDALCKAFLKAADTEGEGAWRMPLAQGYDDMLKSGIADVKNVGGRTASSITAAQFLQRFVQEGMPWIHLDIAGVASMKTASTLAPKGATGWGIMALNRLISDNYET